MHEHTFNMHSDLFHLVAHTTVQEGLQWCGQLAQRLANVHHALTARAEGLGECHGFAGNQHDDLNELLVVRKVLNDGPNDRVPASEVWKGRECRLHCTHISGL